MDFTAVEDPLQACVAQIKGKRGRGKINYLLFAWVSLLPVSYFTLLLLWLIFPWFFLVLSTSDSRLPL